ncbi:MAG: PAS domain S-box protein [Acidobacteriota bacterium]
MSPDDRKDTSESHLHEELSTLDIISHLLTTSNFNLDVLLNDIVQVAAQKLHVKACAIRLLDEKTGELVLKGVYGLGAQYLDKGPVIAAKSVFRDVIESGDVTEIFDVSQDARIQYSNEAITEGISSILVVGLMRESRALGALSVYTDQPHHFDLDEVKTFQAIANQTAVAVYLTQLHISERERSQLALRRSEERIRAILDTVIDGIITIDEKGIIGSFNPGSVRIFGYNSDEVIGKNIKMLMPEPDRSQHDHYLTNYLKSSERKIIGIGRDVTGRRKDGTTFPMYIGVGETDSEGQKMFTGIVRDLTEVKRLQDRILQTQSLAAIGEMAAVLAHEIKNPLAGIGGAIEILLEDMTGQDQRRSVMEEVLAQVKRLDGAVRQLLMLSKPWTPNKQPCDLRAIIAELCTGAAEQKPFQGIEFVLNGTETALAPVDPTFFEQVLWNLFHNAVEAMPDGGTIRCTFGLDSDCVTVSVSDTGSGISRDQHDQLFRPFFTTKTRGTGLGLSICKKIMEAHQGAIVVSSAGDEGTTFILSFPKGDLARSGGPTDGQE